jgi:hypothetical protein
MSDHDARNRVRIAEQAARLIAEHGIRDYALAKRKAARQLGLPEGYSLPRNDEIDAALIERQALFEPEEQLATLAALRNQALEVMRVFARFEPMLTGGVVTGAVSEHSQIELDLNAESSKDFEQFLLNNDIEFKVMDRAGRMAYLIYSGPADVIVRVLSVEPYNAPGGSRPRLTLAQLERMLEPA